MSLHLKNYRQIIKLVLLLTLTGLIAPCFANATQAPFKTRFIQKMATAAKKENQRIANQRAYLLKMQSQIAKHQSLSNQDIVWLQSVAKLYRVKDFNRHSTSQWQKLLSKANIIPNSMAIAQAINESSWGRSRFATEGHNLYGIWCYRPGCGMVPKRRAAGKTYEVKSYPSIQASVQDYFLLINRSRAYRTFRQQRAILIKNQEKITGLNLIKHLKNYSQIGQSYNKIIQQIIQHYNLYQFDSKAV